MDNTNQDIAQEMESLTFDCDTFALEFFITDNQWRDFLNTNKDLLQKIAFETFQAGNLEIDTNRINHINIIFCSDSQIHALNREHRNVDKPTNVLSFPTYDSDELENKEYCFADMQVFGDVYVAYNYCLLEAKNNHKNHTNHIAHMIVHGILHILGHDHIDESEAETMESLEIALLTKHNIDNPYSD